jgi:hypothetical protein
MTPLPIHQQQALTTFREFLQTCWTWSHEIYYKSNFHRHDDRPSIACTYWCEHTSTFLRDALASVDPRWHLVGGFMSNRDGGPSQPHWWLENGQCLVDLTAEQFGWEPVVIAALDDPRYQRHGLPTRRNLRNTLAQWKGQSSRPWMDNDDLFQKIKAQTKPACDHLRKTWGEEIVQALVAPPRRRSRKIA